MRRVWSFTRRDQRRPEEESKRTDQRFGDCFDEHVALRGYALTSRIRRDDDARSAFASCGRAAALALGSNVRVAAIAAIRRTGVTEHL